MCVTALSRVNDEGKPQSVLEEPEDGLEGL